MTLQFRPLAIALVALILSAQSLSAQENPTLFTSADLGIPLKKSTSAEHSSSTNLTSDSTSLDATELSEQQSVKSTSYVPEVTGAIRAKVEMSLYDGAYRFNTRNSRFGLKGNVSPNMFYRVQVDFSNEGSMSILDAYVGARFGNFEAIVGQQLYHFSTELDRGPSDNYFINRPFLSKYLTSYYGSTLSDGKVSPYLKTMGGRDLGAMFTYKFKDLAWPVKLFAGFFNGSGINNPEWGHSVNFIGRAELGRLDGFRFSMAYYNGFAPDHDYIVDLDGVLTSQTFVQSLDMVGAEAHYEKNNLWIEAEYSRRYLGIETGEQQVMVGALLQSYYKFPMKQSSPLAFIAPIGRWDMGNNVLYSNLADGLIQTVNANRITLGVNVGFKGETLRSEIRFNYEKYMMANPPSDLNVNPLFQDKVSIEFVAAF